MIGSEFYKGQGFGNQLWIYASVRSIAEKNNYDYGFLGVENFKGRDFLKLDFGKFRDTGTANGPTARTPIGFTNYIRERQVIHPVSRADISPIDSRIIGAPDGTFIDGPLQAEGYLFGARTHVSKWFSTHQAMQDKCIISLRGGEYRNIHDVFLPKQFYLNAINRIREIDPHVVFEVVTDDLKLAKEYFPDFSASSSGGVKIFFNKFYFSPSSMKIGKDFAKLQSAKYLILSNSSFSWWGAYTNPYVHHVIAPKFWARHNISDGYWSQGDSLTTNWEWLDRFGQFSDYSTCLKELTALRMQGKYI